MERRQEQAAMNYEQVLTTIVSGVGLVLATCLAKKVVDLIESGVSFFGAREKQALTQTIDAVKHAAVDLAVMRTEQMVVSPAKKTGAWRDMGQRLHARDYAVETATRYLERRSIVSPPEELLAMIEARVAEAKVELRVQREQVGKDGEG